MAFRMNRTEKQFNKMLAHKGYVQGAVEDAAKEVGGRAKQRLRKHRDQGHARITVRPGPSGTDWYVSLNDERGQRAAAAIEYGWTQRDEDGNKYGHEGLGILTSEPGVRRRRG